MVHRLAEASASNQECARCFTSAWGTPCSKCLEWLMGKMHLEVKMTRSRLIPFPKWPWAQIHFLGITLPLPYPSGQGIEEPLSSECFFPLSPPEPSAKSSGVPQSEHLQEPVAELRPWAGDTPALSAPKRLFHMPYSHRVIQEHGPRASPHTHQTASLGAGPRNLHLNKLFG